MCIAYLTMTRGQTFNLFDILFSCVERCRRQNFAILAVSLNIIFNIQKLIDMRNNSIFFEIFVFFYYILIVELMYIF